MDDDSEERDRAQVIIRRRGRAGQTTGEVNRRPDAYWLTRVCATGKAQAGSRWRRSGTARPAR